MSNRRRPQRRDSHGALRSSREKLTAVLVALGVVLATALAVVILHHRDPAPVSVPVNTSSTPASTPPSSTPGSSTPPDSSAPSSSTPSSSTPADGGTPTSSDTTASSAP
jgi:hypothetical protein